MDNGNGRDQAHGSGDGPAGDSSRNGEFDHGAGRREETRASRSDLPAEHEFGGAEGVDGAEGIGSVRGAFGALGASGPFGAAGISLLLNILVERTRSRTWSVERQRAHARALLDLARDHWFTEEETAVLCAFLR